MNGPMAPSPLVANQPPLIDAEPHNHSSARPLPALDPGKSKSVRSARANGKLSLMATMAF
jgi:hypothetical protein